MFRKIILSLSAALLASHSYAWAIVIYDHLKLANESTGMDFIFEVLISITAVLVILCDLYFFKRSYSLYKNGDTTKNIFFNLTLIPIGLSFALAFAYISIAGMYLIFRAIL